jgi:hypothetical protein
VTCGCYIYFQATFFQATFFCANAAIARGAASLGEWRRARYGPARRRLAQNPANLRKNIVQRARYRGGIRDAAIPRSNPGA